MERQVQVWQVTDPVGNPLHDRFPAHDLHKLVSHAHADGADLYATERDGTQVLMEASNGGSRPHLTLYTIRRANLPSEDASGRIIDLSIDANHGLAEGTHFLFCPRNVVVCLYNHFGPRIKRLGAWLSARAGLDVTFSPLYRTDVWAVIDEMERLTAVEVSIPADQAANLPETVEPDEGRSTLDALRNAGHTSGGGTVRMTWSVGRGGHTMSQEKARGILRDVYEVRRRGFTVAKAYGRIEGVEQPIPVDLIEDQLITRRTVEPETSRSRRLATSSAYAAMDTTYEQFKDQIEQMVDRIESTERLSLPETILPRPSDDG